MAKMHTLVLKDGDSNLDMILPIKHKSAKALYLESKEIYESDDILALCYNVKDVEMHPTQTREDKDKIILLEITHVEYLKRFDSYCKSEDRKGSVPQILSVKVIKV